MLTPFVGAAGKTWNCIYLAMIGTLIWGATNIGIGTASTIRQVCLVLCSAIPVCSCMYCKWSSPNSTSENSFRPTELTCNQLHVVYPEASRKLHGGLAPLGWHRQLAGRTIAARTSAVPTNCTQMHDGFPPQKISACTCHYHHQ